MRVKAKIMNINYSKNNYYILKINIKENSNRQCKLRNTTLKGTINTPVAKGDLIEFEASFNSSENNLTFKEMYVQDLGKNDRIANFCTEHTEKISKDTFCKILKDYKVDEIIQDNSILEKYKLSKKKKTDIVEMMKKYKEIEYINHIIALAGATTEQAYAIYSIYNTNSNYIIENNPYQLYFDKILEWKESERLAILYDVSDKTRNEALVFKQIFDYCYNLGNTCIPESELEHTETLEELINNDKLIKYKDCIYTKKLYESERTLEKTILDIVGNTKKNKVDTTQEEAVFNALNCKISIITGGAGVGKTYTINRIVQELESKNYTYVLLSPTGKAADRLAELTKMETSTIHRKLKLLPYSDYQTEEEITEDYCIIDECSMLDLELSACLFTHISDNTKIILVGDVNQIPSVGVGRIFQDLIESNLIKVTKLNKVYRQASDSGIVANSYKVLNNEELDFTYNDFEFIETDNIEEIQNYIKNNYNEHTQILSPMHESQLGTDTLNLIIQNRETQGFYIGDKVIQNVNDYDLGVFNGNLGEVTNVEMKAYNSEYQQIITVEFENINKTIEYNRKNINEIELAYALTIHKSQGSEFDTVIIPIHSCIEYMLNKNLIYTAITRAKKKLIFIGSKTILEETRHKVITRKSNLF